MHSALLPARFLRPGARAARKAERIVECPRCDSSLAIGSRHSIGTKELPAAQWSGSGWAMDAIRAALTATAHILVTRSGAGAATRAPALHTLLDSRRQHHERSAVADGPRERRFCEFIRWYAPFQRADGFVPCCVDDNGPDWLVEHDSHGQLIAAIADCYRFTTDARFLEESWPFVVKAVACIEGLLEEDGLLPCPSAMKVTSHSRCIPIGTTSGRCAVCAMRWTLPR